MKNSVIPMGGTLRATFVLGVAVLLCTFAVFTVRANVLVYEGFSSADYTATSDYTASSLSGK